jgi:AmmeMemoRadiSam system protein B/AmmeMemoRadiSam system protein A
MKIQKIACIGVCVFTLIMWDLKKGVSLMNPEPIDPKNVRKPAVAGAFYPADPEVLRKQVDGFLARAESQKVDGQIVALISPHAGYPYSGQIAGTAFKQVQGNTYDAVIVIAPSHSEYFDGVSVLDRGGYETPLGVLPVEEATARAIVQGDEIVKASLAGHRGEHSLEVQLPFLQAALVDPKIVPIVMADRSQDTCERLARALSEAVRGKNVLIVASSDLYHGYSYEECVAADTRTLEVIEAYDPGKLCNGLAKETYQACGGGPIAVALLVARNLGADRAKVIARTNSNDVMGERSGYCVGYAAVAIYKSTTDSALRDEKTVGVEIGLGDEDKKRLLEIARVTIEKKIRGEKVPEFQVASEILNEHRGAFVTIHKRGQLRGCIGYIEPIKPLYLTVQEMAESAALHDPRFSPVSVDELDDLEIEISALTPLERIENVDEIEIGLHGIYMKKGYSSGLLLPQVATDYGWDRMTFLEHTCMKAGLPTDAWQEADTEIYIFSADIFSEPK